jgi:predicted Zn-dependent protease
MIRNKVIIGAFLFASVLSVMSLQPSIGQSLFERGESTNGALAPPPVQTAPDLTPPGYLPTDPLYNDPEVKLGRTAAEQIAKEAKFCQDKAVVARVSAIGAKVASVADTTHVKADFGNDKLVPYHYTYHVIESKEVNAFSLPGGSIYIYKGMLDLISSDDELAGVLGHETAHAAHHHVSTLDKEANKMSNTMLLAVLAAIIGHVDPGTIAGGYTAANAGVEGVLNNTYSEHAEEDADHTGMIFMQKAGFNPVGMLTMLERLGQDEKQSPEVDLAFLQDHPLTPERIVSARDELSTLGVTIDAEAIREADNALPVLVSAPTTPPGKTVTLFVSNKPIVTLAEVDRPQAVAAAKVLDKLLNNNLQTYEVKTDGPNLIAATKNLITITDADAAVQAQPITPDALALQAKHNLALVLWSEVITGVGP